MLGEFSDVLSKPQHTVRAAIFIEEVANENSEVADLAIETNDTKMILVFWPALLESLRELLLYPFPIFRMNEGQQLCQGRGIFFRRETQHLLTVSGPDDLLRSEINLPHSERTPVGHKLQALLQRCRLGNSGGAFRHRTDLSG